MPDNRYALEVTHDELFFAQAIIAGACCPASGDRLVAAMLASVAMNKLGSEGIDVLLEKINAVHEQMSKDGLCDEIKEEVLRAQR